MQTIYLDYSTTSPVAASVRDKMLPFLSEFFGHPASTHWYGRAAQEAIEDARSSVATLLNCHPAEIVFSSGGTESVNLAILGAARAAAKAFKVRTPADRPHLITTTLEHACVRRCAEQLEREGWSVTLIGCDTRGVIRLEELRKAIRDSTLLVSTIHASHRIGTIQPLEEIAQLCTENEILLHTDAAQSVGKIACDVESLGVDLLSFSGHKMYAPKGVGGLYVRLGTAIEATIFGEGYEAGMRAGTSNVPGIVGLGQAARLATLGLENSIDRISEMRERFHQQLESIVGRKFPVHGADALRVPGILSMELPGVTAEALQQRLPEICFGPTNRCAAPAEPTDEDKKRQRSSSFGPTELQSPNTLRLSFGWTTSEDELQRAIHLIAAAYEALAN